MSQPEAAMTGAKRLSSHNTFHFLIYFRNYSQNRIDPEKNKVLYFTIHEKSDKTPLRDHLTFL
jgi:hypothetical protein